jgi:hypothetical protein
MHCLHIPGPPLASFIRCFWYWKSAPHSTGVPGAPEIPTAPTHGRERLLPNGEASIVFNLKDEEMRLYDADDLSRFVSCGVAGLTGARTRSFAIDTTAEEWVVGIQFRPGGPFPFFREPAGEVANQCAPLECLWGGAAGEIREQLLEAASVEALFAALERSLLERMVRPLELHPAIEFARGHICGAPGGRQDFRDDGASGQVVWDGEGVSGSAGGVGSGGSKDIYTGAWRLGPKGLHACAPDGSEQRAGTRGDDRGVEKRGAEGTGGAR